jgi:predicted nucleic acid-binding protein
MRFTSAMRFVDTNILLYAISSRPEELEKAARAASLLGESDLAFSVQVLQEFYVQATRPTATVQIEHDTALAFMRTLERFPIQAITLEVLELALEHKQRWQISYWDAAIVAAARRLGCKRLITEDLQHGQDFDGIMIVNPFL